MTPREAVHHVLNRHCGVPEHELRDEARLVEDLGLDSVGLLTLMTELEDHYQRDLQEDPDHPPRSVGELVRFLEGALTPES